MRFSSLCSVVLMACGSSSETPSDTTADPGVDVVGEPGLGHCIYENSLSGGEECRSYTGDGWTVASATENCDAPGFPASPGTFVEGTLCAYSDTLGSCAIDEGTPEAYALVFPGTDGDTCAGLELGCGFAGGTFTGEGACAGETGGPIITDPFTPFAEVCVDDPKAPNGEVCVWNAISGAVQEGYAFKDYGDCDAVRTQRPYVPYDAGLTSDPNDPRLDDPAWVAEFGWVTAQVESTACVCCHSTSAPDGASGWHLDLEPIWLNSANDDAVAMFAGWTDSFAFGAFDAEVLYGFDRTTTGIPTTDPDRFIAFMEAELARRGRTRAEFADDPPWGGPLVDQLNFEPGPCDEGVGVDSEGRLNWKGGDARYVYVLEPDATSPTVPPNLDLPTGTRWRVEVSPDQDPIASGLTYGTIPLNATQGFPESNNPAQLEPGRSYYLVALADIIQPIERCIFTAP